MFRVLTVLLCMFWMTETSLAVLECPEPSETDRYVESAIFKNVTGSYGKLKIYYKLLAPYSPDKPTLVIINGGPGGDHSLVRAFTALENDFNLVGIDHRGLSCTRMNSKIGSDYIHGLYTIKGAADDMDAVRKDLLGEKGEWYVYGVSYGGMLGQKYAIEYPTHIKGLILDSTFHTTRAIDAGRQQYKGLFLADNPASKGLWKQVIEKYPDSHDHILRKVFHMTYGYKGRTSGIPTLLKTILEAPTPQAAKEIYSDTLKLAPWWGMSNAIICSEIWDHAERNDLDRYYFSMFALECPKFDEEHRTPMAWDEDLKKLPMRTLILAGKYDPVTPASIMREMRGLIPNSALYENPHTGHGLYFEKFDCTKKLFDMFFAGASLEKIETEAKNELCQSAPNTNAETYRTWHQVIKSDSPF